MNLPFQNDVNEKELTALKAIIRCIEDHKLEEQFPVDPLQKQVMEIEKAKADKKRATEVAKPQSKRPVLMVLLMHMHMHLDLPRRRTSMVE